MKKTALLLTFLMTLNGFAQKATALAKSGTLTLELAAGKFSFLEVKSGKKDVIFSKAYELKNPPSDAKITPFTSGAKKLFLVNWIQKGTTKTADKTELVTSIFSEVWDIDDKSQVLTNCQKTVNVQEIRYLGPNRDASETVEKIRREGFEFQLQQDGAVILKNKTQQDRMVYDASQKTFVKTKK